MNRAGLFAPPSISNRKLTLLLRRSGLHRPVTLEAG
jgi:hypothetical protein